MSPTKVKVEDGVKLYRELVEVSKGRIIVDGYETVIDLGDRDVVDEFGGFREDGLGHVVETAMKS